MTPGSHFPVSRIPRHCTRSSVRPSAGWLKLFTTERGSVDEGFTKIGRTGDVGGLLKGPSFVQSRRHSPGTCRDGERRRTNRDVSGVSGYDPDEVSNDVRRRLSRSYVRWETGGRTNEDQTSKRPKFWEGVSETDTLSLREGGRGLNCRSQTSSRG